MDFQFLKLPARSPTEYLKKPIRLPQILLSHINNASPTSRNENSLLNRSLDEQRSRISPRKGAEGSSPKRAVIDYDSLEQQPRVIDEQKQQSRVLQNIRAVAYQPQKVKRNGALREVSPRETATVQSVVPIPSSRESAQKESLRSTIQMSTQSSRERVSSAQSSKSGSSSRLTRANLKLLQKEQQQQDSNNAAQALPTTIPGATTSAATAQKKPEETAEKKPADNNDEEESQISTLEKAKEFKQIRLSLLMGPDSEGLTTKYFKEYRRADSQESTTSAATAAGCGGGGGGSATRNIFAYFAVDPSQVIASCTEESSDASSTSSVLQGDHANVLQRFEIKVMNSNIHSNRGSLSQKPRMSMNGNGTGGQKSSRGKSREKNLRSPLAGMGRSSLGKNVLSPSRNGQAHTYLDEAGVTKRLSAQGKRQSSQSPQQTSSKNDLDSQSDIGGGDSQMSSEEELDMLNAMKEKQSNAAMQRGSIGGGGGGGGGKGRLNKKLSLMYGYTSPLDLEIQKYTSNNNQINLFAKLEPFDEVAANALVASGLNLRNINKELSFVQNDLSGIEWLAKMKGIRGSYHAHCIFFKDNQYCWEKVRVNSFNQTSSKFRVIRIDNGQEKEVSRNVLAFRFERMENVIERIEMIQSKGRFLKDERKFQAYLDSIDNSLVSAIPTETKLRIFNMCLGDNTSALQCKIANKLNREKILSQGIEEVDQLYRNKMKEQFVIAQMEKDENRSHFLHEAQIDVRMLVAPVYPSKGCVFETSSENIVEITKQILVKRNAFLKTECFKALINIKKITLEFTKHPILDLEMTSFVFPIDVKQLTKRQVSTITHFSTEKGRAERAERTRMGIITKFRERILNEIQDKMTRHFGFFEQNKESFLKSKLYRHLKRMEFSIQSSLEQDLLISNCNSWIQFLQSFTFPQLHILSPSYLKKMRLTQTNEDLSQELASLDLSSIWVSKNSPLLILSMSCNKDDGKIAFSPSFDDICAQLYDPLRMLKETACSFQRLERTIVPFIEIGASDNYTLEHKRLFMKLSGFISIFVQEQWDAYVNPLVEIYSRFASFFLPEITQIVMILSPSANINQVVFMRELSYFWSKNPNASSSAINSNTITQQISSTSSNAQNSQKQSQQQSKLESTNRNDDKTTSNSNNANNNSTSNNTHANSSSNNNNSNSTTNHQSITADGGNNSNTSNSAAPVSSTYYSLSKLKSPLEIKEIISKIQFDIFEARTLACDTVSTPLFKIDVAPCKASTALAGQTLIKTLLKTIYFVTTLNIKHLYDSFDKLSQKISHYPKTEDDLVVVKVLIEGGQAEIDKLSGKISEIGAYMGLMEEFLFYIDPETQEKYWMLYTCPQKVRKSLYSSRSVIESQEKRFKDALEKERYQLQLKIEKIAQDFQTLKNFNNYQLAKDYSMEAQSLNDHISDASYQRQQINKREVLLSLPNTKYMQLEQIKEQSAYFIKMWELAFELQIDRHKWIFGSLMKIQFPQFKQRLMEYDTDKELIRVKIQELTEDKSIIKVLSEIQKDIDLSREVSWMMEYLTTEAMVKQPQFYRDLFKECNLPAIEPNDDMSLKSLIDIDLVHFRDQIREVSERAENLYNTERQLSSIDDRLKETPIEVKPFRDGHFLIGNFAAIFEILDEQNIVLADVRDTGRVKLAPKKVADIEEKLQSVRKNIELIMEYQELFVQAIEKICVGSSNLTAKLFQTEEDFWKHTIKDVKENNSLYEIDFNFEYESHASTLRRILASE